LSGFQTSVESGVLLWVGDPDCDAAHAMLLAGLKKLGTRFMGAGQTLSQNQKGNLGEYICLHIDKATYGPAIVAFAQNAIQPLSKISAAGVDLMLVYFDPTPASQDMIYIQEVKTTGADNLDYLNSLEADYRKLFSLDLDFTLQSRIQLIANKLEVEQNNEALADRVLKLGATTPKECTRIKLLPTGVHELSAGNPVQKMLAIRTTIAGLGWSPAAIEPWSIGLSDLDSRLLRLARGMP